MTNSRLGRYEILEELGQGGLGRVVRARDLSLLRQVAIKIVPANHDEEFVERLRTEARATAILSHPNIVTVFDVGMDDDAAYIVMEYVSGTTLETRMRSVPAAEWPRFIPMLAQCGDALDFAHRKGIIHRDIKPSNIMIRDDAIAKVLDFGIAKVVAGRETGASQQDLLMGTPRYMAPEQIRGVNVGPWSDQYALATILYTLLSGRHPIAAEDMATVIRSILQDPVEPPSQFNKGVGSGVDRVILQALAKQPGDRFGTCREMFSALLEAVAEDGRKARERGGLWQFVRRLQSLLGYRAAEREMTESLSELLLNDSPAPNPLDSAADGPTVPPPLSSAPGDFTRFFKAAEQTVLLRHPAQSRVDADALARARARELLELLNSRDFESAIALRGKWLPGIEGAPGELISFSETARYLAAAQDAVSPHVRIEHLERAEKILFSAGNQLLSDFGPGARHLVETLEAWKGFTRELLAAAKLKAEEELPNPFRAGQPLRPDQGRAVFRGRDGLVRRIEAILADAEQNYSLALLGPRRCGKTSLLQMLPAMLPDCACVFFDLQDNPVSTVPEFFEALARRAREQVKTQRRLTLPALSDGGTFESASRWLEDLDKVTEVNRILVSIDEFERLEDLFPGDRRELLRLMGLLRATIQHRRKVRLLVSGVSPFEELGSLWNDHFINVRELSIGHLDEATSVDLLTRPIPEFPATAIPEAVAKSIYLRTGGQPYLVQLFGALLVHRLNEASRRVAELEDVPQVELQALSEGRYYFGNTFQDAPAEARAAMAALARGESPVMAQATRRWLERRWLIKEGQGLAIPALGAFIQDEGLEETIGTGDDGGPRKDGDWGRLGIRVN